MLKMPFNGTEMCTCYDFDQAFVVMLDSSFNNARVWTYRADLVI